jgi:hypothetical protein
VRSAPTPLAEGTGPLVLIVDQPLARDPSLGELGPYGDPGAGPTVNVTGTGSHREVGWPEGGALTQRWLTAHQQLRWQCPPGRGQAARLDVAVQDAPGRLIHEDLTPHHLQGATSSHQLYLWPLDEVRRACAKDGDVDLPSRPISLSLQCQTGAPLTATVRVPLHVHCLAAPPAGEVQTVAYARVAERQGCAMTSQLEANVPTAVTFCGLLPRTLAPEPESIRLVQLDEHDRVLEAQPPCFQASSTPADHAPECKPTLTVTGKVDGTLRFAYEVTFADGTREHTRPIPVAVRTPEGDARRSAELKAAQEKWAATHGDERWQTYVNARYGYRLDYPPDWEHTENHQYSEEVKEHFDGVGKLSGTRPSGPISSLQDVPCGGMRAYEGGVIFYALPALDASADAWATEHLIKRFQTANKEWQLGRLEYPVGGETAYEVMRTRDSLPMRQVVFRHGDRIFVASAMAQFIPAPEFLAEVDRILRSFAFSASPH